MHDLKDVCEMNVMWARLNEIEYSTWEKVGVRMILTSIVLTVISVTIAYGLDNYLTLGQLVIAHLMTILSPVGIKFGYVLALYARQQQGLPAI